MNRQKQVARQSLEPSSSGPTATTFSALELWRSVIGAFFLGILAADLVRGEPTTFMSQRVFAVVLLVLGIIFVADLALRTIGLPRRGRQ